MERAVKTGELFATFNYDGKDCADMGIYSITSGATYAMNIEPTFSDNKVEVPAYDGKYYYGTQITGQQFQFTCFCHDLVASEYDRMRAWLSPRRIGRLILSDQPYKYYLVKPISVSALSAYPLTTIQTPSNTLFGNSAPEDVVYTGNFTITFETVGSAYGYGFSYYRDDLIYDAKKIYGRDYYYNSGLLYKDMSPRANWEIEANAKDQKIPMYNPGSSMGQPQYTIKHTGAFAENSFIQFNNPSVGTSTIIDIGGIEGDIVIDTESQTLSAGGNNYYGRFSGTLMKINPFLSVIEIPEKYVENIEDTDLLEYDSFYIENNVVSFNEKVLKVSTDMVGRYFCTNMNGGSEIISVDVDNNSFTLDPNVITYDIGPGGMAFNYVGSFEELPEEGSLGDVCEVDGVWYTYREDWVVTNLFDDAEEFYDHHGNTQTVYRAFGATIVDLDELTITTGTNINYKDKENNIEEGASVDAFTLVGALQPRYL